MEATEDAGPLGLGSTEGLGPADDIRDNARAMIFRWPNCTKLHIAKKFPGCFRGAPDAVWARHLTNDECEQLLDNPHCMFEGPNVGHERR